MIWRQHIHKVVLRLPDSWSNWNLKMLVFEERGTLEALGEFSTVIQTLDFVSGLNNYLEFSQPLSCLYGAMQTENVFYCLNIAIHRHKQPYIRHCLGFQSWHFSEIVGCNIQPSSSATNRNAALIIDHQLHFTNSPTIPSQSYITTQSSTQRYIALHNPTYHYTTLHSYTQP